MTKKNDPLLTAVVGLAFSPIAIPIMIGKAIHDYKKDMDYIKRQEQKEAERIAAAKSRKQRQLEAEIRKQEKLRRAEFKEEERTKLAFATLEDRYGEAEKQYNKLQRNLSHTKDLESRISLYKESVSLVPLLLDYSIRKNNIDGSKIDNSSYCRDFYQLSKVYEEYGLFDYAIQACKDALEYGFIETYNGVTFADRIEALNKLNEG